MKADGRGWRHFRRRWLAGGALAALVVAAAVAIAVTGPFGGPAKASAGVSDNAYPTSTVRVKKEGLSSETEVQGTLGYATAGNATTTDVVLPAGTASSSVSQAEEQVATARQGLASDEAALRATENAGNQGIGQAQEAAGSDQGALRSAGQSNAQALSQAEQAASAGKGALRTTQQSNAQALSQAEQAASADKGALRTTQQSNAQALSQA
ncbi:MAG: hypothetical protein ACRDZX_06260, partial [Acidimicrobiales bacterium]